MFWCNKIIKHIDISITTAKYDREQVWPHELAVVWPMSAMSDLLFLIQFFIHSEHLLTISRDVQFYQLHEVGDFWWKPLDLIVTQAKFS